jgi:hypothetical protein
MEGVNPLFCLRSPHPLISAPCSAGSGLGWVFLEGHPRRGHGAEPAAPLGPMDAVMREGRAMQGGRGGSRCRMGLEWIVIGP